MDMDWIRNTSAVAHDRMLSVVPEDDLILFY